MNQYIATAKDFVTTHKKKIIIGAEIALAVLLLAIVILLFLYNIPKDSYQAVRACDRFTAAEAQSLLGDKVLGLTPDEPIISNNLATSKCSYTDTNQDKSLMKVAAIAIRTGINDEGVQQNDKDFAINESAEGMERVSNLGDGAYFDKGLGQLNVLHNREWIIISYGVGSTPQFNTLDDATKLANKVLR